MKTILITGGAGYIGSHTVLELIKNNYSVIIVDNLSNAEEQVIATLNNIVKTQNPSYTIPFYKVDLRDYNALKNIFNTHKIDAVIHFAGLKAVGESVEKPILYYDNNIYSTINLLKIMQEFSVNNIIFSSSATVYGSNGFIELTEDQPTNPASPYGRTKLYIEEILKDICVANKNFNAIALRYFNPLGAHSSAKIGENPNGIPNNLLPYITRVAKGTLSTLSIFGNDYNTFDGTCIRDYIHVVDLAIGHLKALEKAFNTPEGFEVYNLGSGKGYSVLEVINAFENACGVKINYQFAPRRAGDLPEYFANATKAQNKLNWTAQKSLNEMCQDSWNFEKLKK